MTSFSFLDINDLLESVSVCLILGLFPVDVLQYSPDKDAGVVLFKGLIRYVGDLCQNTSI